MHSLCIFTRKHARVLCIYRFNKVRLSELLSYLKSVSHIINIIYTFLARSIRGTSAKFVFLVHCLLAVVVSCIC